MVHLPSFKSAQYLNNEVVGSAGMNVSWMRDDSIMNVFIIYWAQAELIKD